MSVNMKQVEEVEKLQLELKRLRYENKELLSIIKDYKEIDKQANTNFNTMVQQRDDFIQIARNLDRDFNQGKIFKRNT